MSMISCPECGKDISSSAVSCPGCGHPARVEVQATLRSDQTATLPKENKTDVVIYILVALAIGTIWAACSNDGGGRNKLTDTATASSISVNKSADIPPKHEWEYVASKDAISGKEIKQAIIASNNSFEMGFPYQGGTTADITIRKHPRYGKDVYLSINKGQLLCTSYEGCQVSIRFDERKTFKVHANEPEDNSSTVLFLSGYEKLVKEIKKSKKMIIEVVFFQNGSRTFEFDVSNLQFD